MLSSVGTQGHELTCHTLTAAVVRPLGSQWPLAWKAGGKDMSLPQPQLLVTCVSYGSRAETKCQHTLEHTDSCPQIRECCRHPKSTFLEKIPPKAPKDQPATGLGQGTVSSRKKGQGCGLSPQGRWSPGWSRLGSSCAWGPERSLALRGRVSWPLGPGRPPCGCVKGSSILWERGLQIRPCRGYAPQGRPTARCRNAPRNV